VNNAVLTAISESKELQTELDKKKISWQNDMEMVRRLNREIRRHPLFKKYHTTDPAEEGGAFAQDKQLLVDIITEYLSRNENLNSLFEEKYIHWADDTFVAYNSVIRNL